MWKLIFRLIPGWLIRSDYRMLNDLYLWFAGKAWWEEEQLAARRHRQ